MIKRYFKHKLTLHKLFDNIYIFIYNMFGKNTRKCMVRENTYIISDKLVKIIK